jgi:xylose isomerase
MFHAFALGMDSFALGLIKAAAIIEDGRIDAFIDSRYSSWLSGIGSEIRNGQATLEILAGYAEKLGKPCPPESGRQEYLQRIVNEILFS